MHADIYFKRPCALYIPDINIPLNQMSGSSVRYLTLAEWPRWMLIIIGANWLSSSEVVLIKEKHKPPPQAPHGSCHFSISESTTLDRDRNWNIGADSNSSKIHLFDLSYLGGHYVLK